MDTKTINLTEDHLKRSEIVIVANPAMPEEFAARELQRFLRQATGVNIPVVTAHNPDKFMIVLGEAVPPLLTDISIQKQIEYDGFIYYCDNDLLLIKGNNPRGTLNGVYSLLHEWGFRWIYPRKKEEIIPALSVLPIARGSRVVKPSLEIRGICIFPFDRRNIDSLREIIDWMGKNKFNMLMTSINRTNNRKNGWIVEWENVSDQLLPEIQKRGIMLNLSEHSGRYFFPTSYFDKHPEWFAMNSKGERFATGQICYSNKGAITVLADNYVKYVKEHPEIDIIGIWPEDGYGFCQCENCKRPGAVLNAVNKIAERIEQIRLNLTVEYLSYTAETSVVPNDILPRPNMATLVANTRVAGEWLKKSSKVGGKGVYQLNYHISDNTAERACLPLRFEKTRQDCLDAKRIGTRGIIPFYIGIDTWWRSSLNLYFFSQFSWDLQKNSKDVLCDFCEKYFESSPVETFNLFKALENMPIVDQSMPPPWSLWQEWPRLQTDFTGSNWNDIIEIFDNLKKMLKDIKEKCDRKVSSNRRFDAIEAFIEAGETMFFAWHERALAVAAFELRDGKEIKAHIRKVAEYEQRMVDLHDASLAIDLGVNGAWQDFSFFQNWRLQLDKQLLEMKTPDNMRPVIDENQEMEMFLPGLID